MDVKKTILEAAKKVNGTVILTESWDVRVLKAAELLVKDKIAKVVLPAKDVAAMEKAAKDAGINLDGVKLLDIKVSHLDSAQVEKFIEARAKKGLSREDALKLLNEPSYFSMMYLKAGKCDACVCGCVYATADVLRAAIYTVGTAEGIKLISSYFIMIPPEGHKLVKEPVLFSDCAVNPSPESIGLKDIAISTIKNFKRLFPSRAANASFLTFSTHGSAKAPVLDKSIEAVSLTKEFFKDDNTVNIDGEMQFDASIVPEIGKRKAPDSKVAGNANVFIFPDLNAGNIGYKIAERLGGFQALGPIVQGLALPISDLSRGCNAEDIYLISAIMLLK
jgi:phosphate acetyltransferase